MKIGAFKLN